MTERRHRVLLVGPVLPFRGGIAQHTTMLLRAFAEFSEARALSFSRQYPGFLFPGESDRDPAFDSQREPHADYMIDSVNPLTWRAAVRQIMRWKPDLVVIPWWQVYWAPSFGYIARRLRRSQVPVVFLCHNVTEHETAGWKRWLTRQVLGLGSGHVVHTRLDALQLTALLPDAQPIVHLMPTFGQFPASQAGRAREHELELLFFGFVRPYKGLDVLIQALAQLPADLDYRLTVAGEFWQGTDDTERLVADLGVSDRVEIVSHYLTNEEVAEYFGRAHAVVLPYRSATGSAVLAVAYHYERPVVVTRVGGLPDAVEDGVTGFVVAPESPTELACAIVRMGAADRDVMAAAIRRFKHDKLTWRGLADACLQAGGVITQ